MFGADRPQERYTVWRSRIRAEKVDGQVGKVGHAAQAKHDGERVIPEATNTSYPQAHQQRNAQTVGDSLMIQCRTAKECPRGENPGPPRLPCRCTAGTGLCWASPARRRPGCKWHSRPMNAQAAWPSVIPHFLVRVGMFQTRRCPWNLSPCPCAYTPTGAEACTVRSNRLAYRAAQLSI